jgi:hypothetical protein
MSPRSRSRACAGSRCGEPGRPSRPATAVPAGGAARAPGRARVGSLEQCQPGGVGGAHSGDRRRWRTGRSRDEPRARGTRCRARGARTRPHRADLARPLGELLPGHAELDGAAAGVRLRRSRPGRFHATGRHRRRSRAVRARDRCTGAGGRRRRVARGSAAADSSFARPRHRSPCEAARRGGASASAGRCRASRRGSRRRSSRCPRLAATARARRRRRPPCPRCSCR